VSPRSVAVGERTTPREPDPIEQAVADFQAGIEREENFHRIVERYYPSVRAYFSRRVFSPDECLDLTQEVFLGLYKGLDDYRAEARFSYWLFRIAHTSYLKWLRGRKRREEPTPERTPPPKAGRDSAAEEHEAIVVEKETQLEEVLQNERVELLREAVTELPDQMRRCLILRIYQDRSYREIAKAMEISVQTVKAHLFQARKRLRQQLEREFEAIEL